MTAPASARTGSRDASAPTADETAVRAVIDAYSDRLRAADVEGVVGLYRPDAVVMAPDIPTTVGRDALTAVYRAALDALAMDFRFEFDEVVLRGDTAIARTRSTGRNTVRSTGDYAPASHRELFVLRREQDGWRIAWYMFQPLPDQP